MALRTPKNGWVEKYRTIAPLILYPYNATSVKSSLLLPAAPRCSLLEVLLDAVAIFPVISYYQFKQTLSFSQTLEGGIFKKAILIIHKQGRITEDSLA
jgi:hypothetical protein